MRERIILAIDENLADSKWKPMLRLIKRFIHQKQLLFKQQQFGIVKLSKEAAWVLPFTDNAQDLASKLDSFTLATTENSYFDGDSLIQLGNECHSNKQYLRIILLYARNMCVPMINVDIKQNQIEYPNFCIDVLYIHDKALESNRVQLIYEELAKFETDASRNYEITKTQIRMQIAMTELLGNPQHRSNLPKCHYLVLS